MHEIVTLQFGHFANFVGAHFWNTQEAHFNYQQPGDEEETAPELVNHDCLYRIGMTSKGVETYTPRALIFDLKGGFGSINKYKLYETPSAQDRYQQQYDLSWDPSKMETFQEQEYSKSAYQKHLEDEELGLATEEGEDSVELNEIRTWSDYNRVYFHPKSMVSLTGYLMDSEFMPFDVFSYGRAAFIETEKEKDTYDENFRLFTEECDQLQGFQVMADVLDGWGGYAVSYLEQLREDYPKATVVTYGLSDDKMGKSSTMKERQTVAVNETLTMTNLSRLSSLYVPVRAPTRAMLSPQGWTKNIRFDPSNRYHTSAFISTGIDNALLPCRLRHGGVFMADMIGALNWRNVTTIGTLSTGLPFPFGGSKLPDLTGKLSPLLDLSSRKTDEDDQVFSQSVVLRGLEANQFAKYAAGTQKTPREVVDEMLYTLPIGKSLGDSKTLTSLKYPIPTSFPRFFQGLTSEGYQNTERSPPNNREDGTSKVNSVPTISRLAVSTTTRWHLQSLSDSVKKIDLRLLPQFDADVTGGVNTEEFDEAKEALLDLYDIYNE
ncbi:tubulin nucleotide-binding domain-like protein [Linnemannia elongata AG-77]|uniref:Tubulin nucleotide-binding domain-like protein n=1 Tax=Linnemannia elongata AG-77 TaxID=1314771 RepID=A0A197K2A2_9FUNG|nr:tubulin nucleotide-binding domain-like protein [Linnemannia elongata AG-77]